MQCVVIYGLTTCTGQAAANDALFTEAVSWVQAYSGYSILAGDFNMPPSSAPALQPLFQKGFVDVIQYYQSTRSVSLAPTCNEATHNDTMIFPSQMLPWIQRVQTRTDLRLSNHAPLFVHLTVPQSKPDYFVWSLPSSWADLPLPWPELDAVYQQQADSILLDESICDNALDTIDVWKLWARCVEQSVAVLHQRHTGRRLPEHYRGRCRWEPLVFEPPHRPLDSGRQDEYRPPVACTSVFAQQRVKQVRRLSTLLTMRRAFDLHGWHQYDSHRRWLHLQELWHAITVAPGYQRGWPKWLATNAHVCVYSAQCPDVTQLEILLTVARDDANAVVNMANKARRAARQAACDHDVQACGLREHFRAIKGESVPPVTWVKQPCSSLAKLVRSPKGTVRLKLADPSDIPYGSQCRFGTAALLVSEVRGPIVHAQHLSGDIPTTGTFTFNRVINTVEDLTSAIDDYWNPIWSRDRSFHDWPSEDWNAADHILDELAIHSPEIEIRWHDIDQWISIIKTLPNNKARGADGWSFEEFKCLPRAALKHLACLMERVQQDGQWPSAAMQAKLILLPKGKDANSIGDTRPITVLGCLNRLFSRFISSSIIPSWSQWFPEGISCGLQGRGVNDITLDAQDRLEKCLAERISFGGFVLDLRKAFNFVGRQLAHKVLCRLGVPRAASLTWIRSLYDLQRWPIVGGRIDAAIPSTCGIPEGDGMSVLCMLAICLHFHAYLKLAGVDPAAYADNWSWTSQSARCHHDAFGRMQRLTDAFKMPVALDKSWCWGTDLPMRQAWQGILTHYQVPPDQVSIVDHAKDLGILFRYTRKIVACDFDARVQLATDMAYRVYRVSPDFAVRARLITGGIWSRVLYGLEFQFMGPANFAKLRRAATTALVGPWHNASTMLSCAAVSSYLVDPLLYVVISMLRALQKWYWKSPDRVMAFCERVHAFDGDRAIGSASSCALYLREVGLTLGPTGLVSGTAGVSFRIQSVDKTELVRSLHYVWTCRIMPGVGSRKGVPTQVPFDLQTTREAFRALPRHVQKSAVMNITGVAVSGARKFHQWGPQWADQYCVLCQCQDTTQHRVFECPIGKDCHMAP